MSSASDIFEIQDFGLQYETDWISEKEETCREISAADGLVRCVRETGRVDLSYISQLTGLGLHRLIKDLGEAGAIYQDPAPFACREDWEPAQGWLLSASYLSGNISHKYTQACEMEAKFPGCFRRNVTALKALLPLGQAFEDIHISLGAPWIPAEEYGRFLRDLLQLKTPPAIFFNRELAVWKIESPPEARLSVLNNMTYGNEDISALRIIEQTMNAKTVKIYDYHFNPATYDTERILNLKKTLAAQELQKRILREFELWTQKDLFRRTRLEEYYNEALSGYLYTPYNGTFLDFKDIAPGIALYKHQRDAIARIVLSGENVLLAHDVGTGKTYEMIIGIHELYRMGISRKNLLVVPNNVLQDFANTHALLYPGDQILVVTPQAFRVQKRAAVLEQIRSGDYTAVYISHSSFDLIPMSRDYQIRKRTQRIRQLRSAAARTENKSEKHMLDGQADREARKLAQFQVNTKDPPWLCYDQLDIETLVVDEAHSYKNISLETRSDGITGLHRRGSRKCDEMLEKVHHTGRTIFATGTTITNSISDVFVMQKYLQPEFLEFHNLSSFDQWINTFARRETNWEVDVDGSDLREVTRFSSFHNLNELMGLFSLVCDFHHMEEKDSTLPAFHGVTNICVPRNTQQAAYIRELSQRTEAIRQRKVDRTEDNLLKVTTDGRKAALDIRLVVPNAREADMEATKISACAGEIWKLYQRYPGSAQLVFSDLGTPKTGFNIYDALRSHLIRLGIPEGEIAFVHDADSEKARTKLFLAVNEGSLRVIIGSTQKLGVGVNIQKKLRAIHHLSIPWRPADLTQREGRLLRQGNTSDEVFIFRYITEGTFDSYSWQLLENKQRFIASFLGGSCGVNRMDDVADMVLSYAEVKALAIGNPLIKKRVEVANLISRTKMASRQRQKQLAQLHAVMEEAPKKKKKLRALERCACIDAAFYKEHREPVPNDERLAFGDDLLEVLAENILCQEERLFFSYQDFDVILPRMMRQDESYILLRGPSGSSYRVDLTDTKVMGCTQRMDNVLNHLEDRARELAAQRKKVESERKNAKEEFDKGNPYLTRIEELENSLRAIDEELETAKEVPST